MENKKISESLTDFQLMLTEHILRAKLPDAVQVPALQTDLSQIVQTSAS